MWINFGQGVDFNCLKPVSHQSYGSHAPLYDDKCLCFVRQSYGVVFVCLFDFILYVHSTIFQLCGTVLPGLNQY